MANFKEIVTKAVIGKAKKSSVNKFQVKPEQTPDTVLGCWIINHTFRGVNNHGTVEVNGSYDVNIWYSHDNDTKTSVCNHTFTYVDKMNIHLKNQQTLTDASEIIVRSLKQPSVTDVKIVNGNIDLTIEKELGVEIVGDTMIKVSIEDEEDEYEEIIDDEQIDNVVESIDEQINEEYLN
ncbi:MAG: outer spore coat protein CotE [Bacilli bacterium]|nr:outer spore coat protein CotE [Bacilli bacterium]